MSDTGKVTAITYTLLEQGSCLISRAVTRHGPLDAEFLEAIDHRVDSRRRLSDHVKPIENRMTRSAGHLLGLSGHVGRSRMCASRDQHPVPAGLDAKPVLFDRALSQGAGRSRAPGQISSDAAASTGLYPRDRACSVNAGRKPTGMYTGIPVRIGASEGRPPV